MPIPIQFYGVILIAVITLWPLFLSGSWSPVSVISSTAISVGLLILVWKYCSSSYVSFWTGIHVISARLSSGFFNITILYLLPFLVIVYFISIFFTLSGLISGRSRSQELWSNFILKFTDVNPDTIAPTDVIDNDPEYQPASNTFCPYCNNSVEAHITNGPVDYYWCSHCRKKLQPNDTYKG